MVYHEDGSIITTDGSTPGLPALAVGWLDAAHEPVTGEVAQAVLRAVEIAARSPVAVMRGSHQCTFCHAGSPFVPLPYETADGAELLLGNASIEITGAEGRLWRAPTLVVHYIAAHGYAPPDQFCSDVVA